MAYEGTPAKVFVDLPIVQAHLSAATEYVAVTASKRYREGTVGAMRYIPSFRFDSPLEVLFWLWWCAYEYKLDSLFCLNPQAEVSLSGQQYRVDFLIEPSDYELAASRHWTPIAVELDGHAFHERTPEQVARRDSRDRALQSAGWRVFHFSFNEFTAAPVDCVREVYGFALGQWNRVSMQDYKDRHAKAGVDATVTT